MSQVLRLIVLSYFALVPGAKTFVGFAKLVPFRSDSILGRCQSASLISLSTESRTALDVMA